MEINEIKKALYKEKPVAVRWGHLNADKENGIRYLYSSKLDNGHTLNFMIPENEMGETVFGKEEPAQLLIRWLVEN